MFRPRLKEEEEEHVDPMLIPGLNDGPSLKNVRCVSEVTCRSEREVEDHRAALVQQKRHQILHKEQSRYILLALSIAYVSWIPALHTASNPSFPLHTLRSALGSLYKGISHTYTRTREHDVEMFYLDVEEQELDFSQELGDLVSFPNVLDALGSFPEEGVGGSP